MRVGIDPGISGAIARIDDRVTELFDMPVMAGAAKHQEVNGAELARILVCFKKHYDVTVYLEAVSAMPGQGVTSMFSFGQSFGIVKGVLAALQIPVVLVQPRAWKKAAGLIGKEKDAARTLAQRLYPGAPLGRKKDIGRADALLIARFGTLEPIEAKE